MGGTASRTAQEGAEHALFKGAADAALANLEKEQLRSFAVREEESMAALNAADRVRALTADQGALTRDMTADEIKRQEAIDLTRSLSEATNRKAVQRIIDEKGLPEVLKILTRDGSLSLLEQVTKQFVPEIAESFIKKNMKRILVAIAAVALNVFGLNYLLNVAAAAPCPEQCKCNCNFKKGETGAPPSCADPGACQGLKEADDCPAPPDGWPADANETCTQDTCSNFFDIEDDSINAIYTLIILFTCISVCLLCIPIYGMLKGGEGTERRKAVKILIWGVITVALVICIFQVATTAGAFESTILTDFIKDNVFNMNLPINLENIAEETCPVMSGESEDVKQKRCCENYCKEEPSVLARKKQQISQVIDIVEQCGGYVAKILFVIITITYILIPGFYAFRAAQQKIQEQISNNPGGRLSKASNVLGGVRTQVWAGIKDKRDEYPKIVIILKAIVILSILGLGYHFFSDDDDPESGSGSLKDAYKSIPETERDTAAHEAGITVELPCNTQDATVVDASRTGLPLTDPGTACRTNKCGDAIGASSKCSDCIIQTPDNSDEACFENINTLEECVALGDKCAWITGEDGQGECIGANDKNTPSMLPYTTIIKYVSLFLAWKYRSVIKNSFVGDSASYILRIVYKISIVPFKSLLLSFEEKIAEMFKTKLFKSPMLTAVKAGTARIRAVATKGAEEAAFKASEKVAVKGSLKLLGSIALSAINWLGVIGMVLDALDPSAYRSYVPNDTIIINLRNQTDGPFCFGLFLDLDIPAHNNNHLPCVKHQYPSIAQLSLLGLLKESKFKEAIPFQYIYKAYLAQVPMADSKVLELIIKSDTDHSSGIKQRTKDLYNDFKNLINCQPQWFVAGGGDGEDIWGWSDDGEQSAQTSPICASIIQDNNDNAYCDWRRKLTHCYKKMIASVKERDIYIFEGIENELKSATINLWDHELDTNTLSILTAKFPNGPGSDRNWMYKDLIKNYTIFQESHFDKNDYNTGTTCNPDGNWTDTAPPNYDCTGISFTEQGCYLLNTIIRWETAEAPQTKDQWTTYLNHFAQLDNTPPPPPPSWIRETNPIPPTTLKFSIKDRLRINYTDHYRVLSHYNQEEPYNPIVISKPIDSNSTKYPLWYPSNHLIELMCKKGVNVLKELSALSKGQHACGMFNTGSGGGGCINITTSNNDNCNADDGIYKLMARGTGCGASLAAGPLTQEAWLPELYGVGYDETSGLCTYDTRPQHAENQIYNQNYCDRMGLHAGPFQKCEGDFDDDDNDIPATNYGKVGESGRPNCDQNTGVCTTITCPHDQGIPYNYCGNRCEAQDGDGDSWLCDTGDFFFGETITELL